MGFTVNKENIEEFDDYTEVAKTSAIARARVQAREHLLLIRDMYVQQINGIPMRIKKRRTEMIGSAIFFAFIASIVIAAICLYGLIGVVLCCWIMYWITISVKDLVKSVIRFMVMTENKIFSPYIRSKDSFTYRSEERYCREQIRKIEEHLEKLDELKDNELKAYCDEMLGYEYEEKRAHAVLGSADQRMV